MTKKDIMPGIDWEKIKYSTALKITMQNGEDRLLTGYDYWYGNPDTIDIVDGSIYEYKNGQRGELIETTVVQLPNPSIKKIEILSIQEQENHGSHPEVGYVFSKIKELYN